MNKLLLVVLLTLLLSSSSFGTDNGEVRAILDRTGFKDAKILHYNLVPDSWYLNKYWLIVLVEENGRKYTVRYSRVDGWSRGDYVLQEAK